MVRIFRLVFLWVCAAHALPTSGGAAYAAEGDIGESDCGCGSGDLTREAQPFQQVQAANGGETFQATENFEKDAAIREDAQVGKLSAKQIKKELQRRGVPTKGLKTKEALARALTQARLEGRRHGATATQHMVYIPGGTFIMGTDKPQLPLDGEAPARNVTVSSFFLDEAEVTNSQFAEFVGNMSFVTESEVFGWSFVFEHQLSKAALAQITQAVAGAEWWLPVPGAYWRDPEGPGSDVFRSSRAEHPVVQVSWADSKAYCEWRGARLPTEAEWEYACAGPSPEKPPTLFPWGDKLSPGGRHYANIWQGKFPRVNSAEDGFAFTAPAHAFPAQNGYGLKNMLGNVWEWVEDWWTTKHIASAAEDPSGPAMGSEKAKKGGSFLCHKSFCYRYRTVARHHNTPDSATTNNGFRCARSVSPAPARASGEEAGQSSSLSSEL